MITEAAQSFTMPVTRIWIAPSPSANGGRLSPVRAASVALLQISVWPTTASGATDAPPNETAAGSTSVSARYGTSAAEVASWLIVTV